MAFVRFPLSMQIVQIYKWEIGKFAITIPFPHEFKENMSF